MEAEPKPCVHWLDPNFAQTHAEKCRASLVSLWLMLCGSSPSGGVGSAGHLPSSWLRPAASRPGTWNWRPGVSVPWPDPFLCQWQPRTPHAWTLSLNSIVTLKVNVAPSHPSNNIKSPSTAREPLFHCHFSRSDKPLSLLSILVCPAAIAECDRLEWSDETLWTFWWIRETKSMSH